MSNCMFILVLQALWWKLVGCAWLVLRKEDHFPLCHPSYRFLHTPDETPLSNLKLFYFTILYSHQTLYGETPNQPMCFCTRWVSRLFTNNATTYYGVEGGILITLLYFIRHHTHRWITCVSDSTLFRQTVGKEKF